MANNSPLWIVIIVMRMVTWLMSTSSMLCTIVGKFFSILLNGNLRYRLCTIICKFSSILLN